MTTLGKFCTFNYTLEKISNTTFIYFFFSFSSEYFKLKNVVQLRSRTKSLRELEASPGRPPVIGSPSERKEARRERFRFKLVSQGAPGGRKIKGGLGRSSDVGNNARSNPYRP